MEIYNDNETVTDDVENILSTPTIDAVPFNTPESTVLSFTPKGSEEWIRKVEHKFTPYVGQTFSNLEKAIIFYSQYAIACGFEARKSTKKRFRDTTIKTKLMVCHRQGFKESKNKKPRGCKKGQEQVESETTMQNTDLGKIRRFGCKAMIVFKYVVDVFKVGNYVVDQFYEGHNHELCIEKNKEFLKRSRNLDLYHKQTIVNLSKINIGPTTAYKFAKENANGYENIGASLLDFKNCQRDLKCFIGHKDGHMFIERLKTLSQIRKGFYFSYLLDDKKKLRRVFWSDAISRRNYAEFGDAVSFDPTYGTNKYDMVFTPFTGVDNHKKTVLFGAALLSNEDDKAFIWTFEQFLEAIGGKDPQYIITDQDPGIIAAIEAVPSVFKKARHRFCMWHIMKKVSSKVDPSICKETDFLHKISALVWNDDIEPLEFEEKWKNLMTEFDLEGHIWLSGKFNERHKWIPCYFRDLHMGNLLRTTQRSESTNSFFKKFENHYGTLVEFWMRYDSAIEQQRHNYKRLEMESENSIIESVTKIPIEAHAKKIYTHEALKEFQYQVRSSITACRAAGFKELNGDEITTVADAVVKKKYVVTFNPRTKETSCSCKLFLRKGFVCRHIIWIWSGKMLYEIPNKYILSRWTKNALRNSHFTIDGNPLDEYDAIDPKQLIMSEVWSEVYATINLLRRREEGDAKALVSVLRQFREKIEPPKQLTKHQEMEILLDCTLPKEVTILPPIQCKNKGSGKRLVTSKDKAIEKAKKPKRMCKNCKRMAHHDRRNCPNSFAPNPPEDKEVRKANNADYSC